MTLLDSAPTFTDVRVPRDARAIVLLLHGGAVHGTQPVDGRNLSWQRARWLLRDVTPRLRRDRIGGVLLRYRVKGWNAAPGGEPAPVQDARWALERLSEQYDVPIVLAGHSMGARTAVAVADAPGVRGVVALAPWLGPGDSADHLSGKVLRAAHGSMDRITSPAATAAFVERARRTSDATFTDMGPVGHYLLRRVRAWNAFTVASVREILAAPPH
ncbi:alpha/beta fold hydrolase [Nocardioides sp. BP30]|uniref:alpha/beta hydrolase n=1 Tax=Nocardioides sp. BP30 TaxID=3036374 RepID=UPI002469918A|nr:alpha/beta fold hydrolase [Nocardioides sp. BP30]WGL52567.1 alpha/beta fold hydrolase [Nocardioides sp. BP30]